jgi:hypothetical protein
MSTEGNSYELSYLVHSEKREEQVELFKKASHVLLAFPLYVDAMPFAVKSFIESLEHFTKEKRNQKIGFIVQSGFPETAHSRYVARYLDKLSSRLNCNCTGTVIKGGVEAIRIPQLLKNNFLQWFCMFSAFTNFAGVGHLLDRKRLEKSFYVLGKEFGVTGEFNTDVVNRFTEPDRIGNFGFWAFAFVAENLYWNLKLKKNNAFDKRFARPFASI